MNFPILVYGTTTSGDYLSLFTTKNNNSPYILSVTLAVTRPDLV